MIKKIIIFIIIIIVASLFSCAKREPARSPASDDLINKIGEQFNLNIRIEEKEAEKLFDEKNDMDFSKIENFAVRQSECGEVGIFKLYTAVNADYIKEAAQDRILKLQADARNLESLSVANNAEVRSYGNYVYYVAHDYKDKIFKLIENELRGV